MASLPTQTFTQLVRGQVAAIQGAASGLIDFTVGSILRAIVEANSQVVLWLQGLIVQLLTTTRFATSVGADADSWAGDFDFERIEAAKASTQETFGRFSTTLQGIVSIGASVETQDGSQQYVVVLDTANPAYSALLGGYVLSPGVATITAPIQASVAGAGANAAPGQINTITSSIPGIDYCTNAAAVDNGLDAESDTAYRLRFVAWVNSLSKAIKDAIVLAAQSVALNVDVSVAENTDYALGTLRPGFFYVVVDDGSGDPPSTLLAMAGSAVEAVRGFTIQYGIFPPVVVQASVSLDLSVDPNYDAAAAAQAVKDAIWTYLSTRKLGQPMQWSRLAQLAYDATPGIVDVTNIRLNGGQSDLPGDPRQVIKPISVTASTQ